LKKFFEELKAELSRFVNKASKASSVNPEPTFQQISFFATIFSHFVLLMQRQCSDGMMISFCVYTA